MQDNIVKPTIRGGSAAVKIHVIGGGPGGLFFAQLARRALPAAAITVYERNRPHDTFGFGVVFSDRTMANLQHSDAETHEAVRRATVHWDAIEVRHRGQVLRAGGHGFSAIARKRLVEILEEGARRAGADLRFEEEISDLRAIEDCDLLVAADGSNSLVRRTYAREFGASEAEGRARFIWFGASVRYDSFKFIFEETPQGVFAVHAYPFDDHTSTFLVETDEESWRGAGLDRWVEASQAPGLSDLESLRYLEQVFAPHLEGQSILANNSKWLTFRTIRNATWRHEHRVLLGDAAHTAHFSVGSGTKMAMEDAVALTEALTRALQTQADLPSALAAYEARRRSEVERIQEAAAPSLAWWERYKIHMRMEPAPFIFHFLTRTPRVTGENLRRRDPALVEAVEAWWNCKHAPAADSEATDSEEGALPPIATPLALSGLTLANRAVLTEVTPEAFRAEGEGIGGRLAPAAQGAGLVLTAPVAPVGRGRSPGAGDAPNTSDPWAAWRPIIELVHARSAAKIGAGLRLPPRAELSIHRSAGEARARRGREASLQSAYRTAVAQTQAAGFDLLCFCLPSDLDPEAADDALALWETAREAWPADRAMAARLPMRGRPIDVDKWIPVAEQLKAHGCTLLALAVETEGAVEAEGAEGAEASVGEGYWRPLLISERVRVEVGLSTLLIGGEWDDDFANTAILAGRIDLCGGPAGGGPGGS